MNNEELKTIIKELGGYKAVAEKIGVSDSGSEIVIGSDYFEYLYVTNKNLTKREAELLKLFDDMLFSETVDNILRSIEIE